MNIRENTKLDSGEILNSEAEKYSENLSAEYCGFRLNSLANKIKSEYLKLKKQEYRIINP